MKLPTEVFGDVIVVHAPESLNEDIATNFLDFISKCERKQVVVDLDRVEYLDSEGLEAILDSGDRLRDNGGDLKLTTTNRANRKILEITRLDRTLEVFGSVIDAVKAFA